MWIGGRGRWGCWSSYLLQTGGAERPLVAWGLAKCGAYLLLPKSDEAAYHILLSVPCAIRLTKMLNICSGCV